MFFFFQEKPQELSSSELHDKLEYAKTDAENSKQKAFEESIRRWRAEEDAKDILHKVNLNFFIFRKHELNSLLRVTF